MKFLTSIGNGILDTCFAWFTPSWRRKGHDALSALTRYLNYFGHKAKGERKDDLIRLQGKLRTSLATWNKEATAQATSELEVLGDGIANFKRNPAAEMVESFFVIMVVFMGIRTYYTQPFRIPTGSMQPSLNGIIIHPVDEIPSTARRCWDAVTLGSSYVEEVAANTKVIKEISSSSKWLFFTETVIRFDDGSTMKVPCASGAVYQYLEAQGKIVREQVPGPNGEAVTVLRHVPFQQGEVIMRARIDAGDMVFVNRMAYHFRKPERGETFVFDTRGLKTREDNTMADQSNGTHYIKRLCGLPGDTLEIQDPKLIINGEEAQEPTIQRVIKSEGIYTSGGYHALEQPQNLSVDYYIKKGDKVTLQNPQEQPNLREYAALGDNTNNSKDSRYWGPVHQFNILGPASFTLWPFSSHWGGIK